MPPQTEVSASCRIGHACIAREVVREVEERISVRLHEFEVEHFGALFERRIRSQLEPVLHSAQGIRLRQRILFQLDEELLTILQQRVDTVSAADEEVVELLTSSLNDSQFPVPLPRRLPPSTNGVLYDKQMTLFACVPSVPDSKSGFL